MQKKLSLEIDDLNQRNLLCLEDSGFIIAQTKSNKIIFNATNISPDYNPGHAHADSLSFEMSIGNERVFVIDLRTTAYSLLPGMKIGTSNFTDRVLL